LRSNTCLLRLPAPNAWPLQLCRAHLLRAASNAGCGNCRATSDKPHWWCRAGVGETGTRRIGELSRALEATRARRPRSALHAAPRRRGNSDEMARAVDSSRKRLGQTRGGAARRVGTAACGMPETGPCSCLPRRAAQRAAHERRPRAPPTSAHGETRARGALGRAQQPGAARTGTSASACALQLPRPRLRRTPPAERVPTPLRRRPSRSRRLEGRARTGSAG
jgi:hypothetical protein